MKKWTAYPYVVWSIMFIVFPLILVLLYSVTSPGEGMTFTLEHYKRFMEPLYLNIFTRSLVLAIISTLFCLILGYPIAMILAEKEVKKRNILILLFVLPMWMNFLLRTYAWMSILGKNGFINSALRGLGLPTLKLLYTNGAVILGMIYNFLPFMVLPIYTVLMKIDKNIVEAAKDLGANKFTVFIKIIFPLSLPGVMSGITMVFMPAVSTFVIPNLLGGKKYMLGNFIEQQFLSVGNWNFGSAISIIMMILILISMALMAKYDEKESGGGLW
jgi:spermidine/putrescine transport system permease protein